MDGDDTFEEFERVAMNGAAALSRAAEVLIRNAQDNKVRATAQTAQATEDLQRRAEGQSRAAELYYARATTEPGWARRASAGEVALTWKGAQKWAEVDVGRFGGYADALTDQVRAEYGFDPHETGSGLDAQSRGCREQVEAHQRGRGEAGAESDGDQVPGAVAGVTVATRTDAAELGYDTAERRAVTSAALTAAGVSEPAREAKMVADHLNGTDPQAVTTAAAPRRSRATGVAKPTRDRGHDRGR